MYINVGKTWDVLKFYILLTVDYCGYIPLIFIIPGIDVIYLNKIKSRKVLRKLSLFSYTFGIFSIT